MRQRERGSEEDEKTKVREGREWKGWWMVVKKKEKKRIDLRQVHLRLVPGQRG